MKKFIVAVSAVFFLLPICLVSCDRAEVKGRYDIKLRLVGDRVTGTLSYTSAEDKEVKFNLYANAYRENAKNFAFSDKDLPRAYPSGTDYGYIEIKSALVNGKTADYELIGEDFNALGVKIDESRGSENTVTVDFETKIPKCSGRLGISGDIIRLADCFPVVCAKRNGEYVISEYSPFGDPYFADVNDYFVEITLPSEYSVASPAYPKSVESAGEETTYSYVLENGRDFALALGENYEVNSLKCDYATVYYYSKGFSEENLKTVCEAIDYFSETFGKYPYGVYSVAETPFVASGMEYSGLCFIADNLSAEDKRLALIHEVAHEWWHGGVGFDETTEAYLDEGLAEYSTYLYLKNNGFIKEAESMLESAKSAYKSFFGIETLLSGDADTTMKRNLKDFKNEYEYVNIAYNKSLIMFNEYGKAVGEKRAVKGLKKFYNDNSYKVADLDALVKSLGLEEFFSSYAEGKVII